MREKRLKMKNLRKFLMIVILLVVAIIVLPIKASAADDTEWTDLTKAKVTFTQKENGEKHRYYCSITGVDFDVNDGNYYYLYLTNGNEEWIKPDFMNKNDSSRYNCIAIEDGKLENYECSTEVSEWIEKSGDLYCILIQYKIDGDLAGDEYKIKIDRTNFKQNPLGNRIFGYFFKDNSYINTNEGCVSTNMKRKVIKLF